MTDRELLCWLHGCLLTCAKAGNAGPNTFKSLADRVKDHLEAKKEHPEYRS